MKTWLNSGRTVFHVNGNLTQDKAVEVVEQARSILGLKPVPVHQLGSTHTLKLP